MPPGHAARRAPADFEASRLSFSAPDGATLAADGFGDPAHPPVVLLHGGGQTRHAWGRAARELAASGWYAVTVDLRGHGDSDWSPDGVYSMGRFMGDVRAIAAGLSAPPVVIGASLGGLAAMAAEGRSRERYLRGLVMVDVVIRMERSGLKRIVGFMRSHPDGFASLEQAADAISEYLPHRPRPDDLSGLQKNLRERPDGRWVWHWDPQFMEPSWRRFGSMVWHLMQAHRHLQIPVLLVRGLKSEVVTDRGVEDFLKRVPHADFADVGEAGHMVAGDRNDAFNQAVLDWLERTFPSH